MVKLIDKIVFFSQSKNLDYCSNTLKPTYPDGQDKEMIKVSIEESVAICKKSSYREHVTPYIWRNSSYFGKKEFNSYNFEEGYNYENMLK